MPNQVNLLLCARNRSLSGRTPANEEGIMAKKAKKAKKVKKTKKKK